MAVNEYTDMVKDRFVNHRDSFLDELFGDTPTLFDKKKPE
jgi:hypothetical protein